MTNFYDDFENRFKNAHFASGWVDVEKNASLKTKEGKNLDSLQAELQAIHQNMAAIEERQLRLSNLAKFYNGMDFLRVLGNNLKAL